MARYYLFLDGEQYAYWTYARVNKVPSDASLSMFGECVGWPGSVKLYEPSDGLMSSTARNRTFLAPLGVGYRGLYGLSAKHKISHLGQNMKKHLAVSS